MRNQNHHRVPGLPFTSLLTALILLSYNVNAQPSNNLCSNATALTGGTGCTGTTGTLVSATYTAITGACGSSSGNRNDVWYSFTANTTTAFVNITGSPANTRFQVYTAASCGGTVTSVACVNASSGTVNGLSAGVSYLIRVYNNTNTSGTFTICVTDVQPNDDCSGAVALAPSLTCTNISGNLYAATLSGTPVITGSCAGTVNYDVWYSFVAPAANAVITMSNTGAGLNNPGLELLSGSCSSMYSLACGSSSINASGLISGTTYYVRAYSIGTAPASPATAGFDLCITYPTPPAPPNDECSGAINLPVNASCSNTNGTVNSATPSAGIPAGCASTPIAYDVWYKFTAVNTGVSTTITIGNFGSGFAATQRIQLFSGTCGSLTSMACGTNSINTTALTQGTTYFVRVYTTTAPAPTTAGGFTICVNSSSPPPRIGNSYVNLSKNTSGGVVEPGDILEIRMTVSLTSGTLYSTRYLDNIPTKTLMLSGNTDSIRVITNEGLTYRRYTVNTNTNDDAGTYVSAPPAGEYNIRLNLGQGSGNMPGLPLNNSATDITGAGNLPSTGFPKGGGGLLFATSFRVQVTGSIGDTITLNGGQFIYKTTVAGSDVSIAGLPYKILITAPLTLCANSIGVNNASEYGGTFGSGSTLNRPADLSFPIAGYSFVAASSAQAIGDGQYAIVNNSSPISGTNQNAYRKNVCPTGVAPNLLCSNRMFGGYWYIDGDHSGTNNAAGNLPSASGSIGGYMLAVNADYVASEAYRQTLTGLCPNTYYEFSAWIENICPTCGADSTGQQFTGTATAPASGYPGVYPNLTFSLDGIDRYSTGQVDTLGWLKKGFVFLTGPTQTTATLSIRNNSQGGGGNDWALDDISIATCFPSMSYSPTSTPVVCKGNTIAIGDTVRSQFSNYTYYVWQRSLDHGTTWTNITTTQTISPTYNGSQYQYITTYNVPASATLPSDSGDIYRVYTATTLSNISNPNCVANDGSAPITLSVLNCGIALKTDLLSFSGKIIDQKALLSWKSSGEDQGVHFVLQKSRDNNNYQDIARIEGNTNPMNTNDYSFTDPELLTGSYWYRVVLADDHDNKKYSRIIQLGKSTVDFDVSNIINPFSDQLDLDLSTSTGGNLVLSLTDIQGKIVKTQSYMLQQGVNKLRLPDTGKLKPGIYTLRIQHAGYIVNKKVLKQY